MSDLPAKTRRTALEALSRDTLAAITIGMGSIKRRRLTLPVGCHPGTMVGDYVPFYFCPRSIMLFLIHRANHPELTYPGGQEPILHLEADLNEAVAWAAAEGRRWAFSLSNAGAVYTEFRGRLDQLGEVNWQAVASRDFRAAQVKEGKQAEFLDPSPSRPWVQAWAGSTGPRSARSSCARSRSSPTSKCSSSSRPGRPPTTAPPLPATPRR